MFNVYVIAFEKENAIYVGCTNDLTRRKDQHNENGRKRHGKFGMFLNDNSIVLKLKDLKTIAYSKQRSNALKIERNTVLALNSSGMKILNDNYSQECSRKGKIPQEILNVETWVVVDFKEHTAIDTNPLKKHCELNGLNYKSMHATSKKVHAYQNRYKAFLKEKWDSLSNKQKESYISGRFLEEIAKSNYQKHIDVASKTYIVTFPDGHEETVKNLDNFAREHKINDGNLHASIKNGRSACGYRARKLD